MMIFWKEKLAFIAVPKTGSTAIEAALSPLASASFMRPPKIKHMTHKRFNRFLRPWLAMEGIDDIKTFAVMREPVSWLGSWYRYRARDALKGHANSTAGISFDQFVEAYLMTENRPAFATFGSQAQQLSRKQNEIGIDHLFRYEELENLLIFIENRFANNITLEQFNVSPKIDISLSGSIHQRLRDECALDFATYDAIAG
jgi:sulfotransferase famil protein